jgi:hypothetical protein
MDSWYKLEAFSDAKRLNLNALEQLFVDSSKYSTQHEGSYPKMSEHDVDV